MVEHDLRWNSSDFRVTGVDGTEITVRLPDYFSSGEHAAPASVVAALGYLASRAGWLLLPAITSGHLLCVPGLATIGQSSADPRLVRLRAEAEKLQQMHQDTDHVRAEPVVEVEGTLPDRYRVTFRCRGIVGIDSRTREPKYGNEHKMEIYCDSDFPDNPPKLTWLTDIYHPNISRSKGVCTNRKEWLAGMGLDEICYQVFEMVQYRNYTAELIFPYPLDDEAAKWVRDYAEPRGIVNLREGVAVDTTPFYKPSVTAPRIKRRPLRDLTRISEPAPSPAVVNQQRSTSDAAPNERGESRRIRLRNPDGAGPQAPRIRRRG